jgi:hypothetical protein
VTVGHVPRVREKLACRRPALEENAAAGGHDKSTGEAVPRGKWQSACS